MVMPAVIVHPEAVQRDGQAQQNPFISCRLRAAAVEQKTSSGMNQMKEQIIPSSPWMTCSSDPESVFASLASPKALLPKCSVGKSVYVCVNKCQCCMFLGYPLLKPSPHVQGYF